MDKVSLRGMRTKTSIGVCGWECEHVRTLLLDLDIDVSERAALLDDTGEAIHYGDMCEVMHANLHEQDSLLLEVLVEHVADLISRDFDALWVWVRIIKSSILPDVEEVGIEVERGAPR